MIQVRCRRILAHSSEGQPIPEEHHSFLLALFQYHDEWQQKSGQGIRSITTQITPHGTRCFVLVGLNGTTIDISFRHAVKLIPSPRSKDLTPQRLLDYKAAARTAIQDQIRSFRDAQLPRNKVCPILGISLTRNNCHVDHRPPLTFECLLFDFSLIHGVNPLQVEVDSISGTVATFRDSGLLENWSQYHQQHADLRLISQVANNQLIHPKVAWHTLCVPQGVTGA